MAQVFTFDLEAVDQRARAGIFHTPHGGIHTPVFAPVGTQATVKAISPAQLEELDAGLLLANTYHLYLRPGDGLIAEMGGLHSFMHWSKPILTDSGGFQVFSLGDRRHLPQSSRRLQPPLHTGERDCHAGKFGRRYHHGL